MEISDAQKFLENAHHGVLVARKKDGSLQMTLVSPVISSDGHVIITSRRSTYKVKNIRRNPQISLLVFGEQFHGSKYIQIDGRAEIIEHPEARRMLRDIKSGKISGLIFSKLARLARNTKELLEFADYFKEHGLPEPANTTADLRERVNALEGRDVTANDLDAIRTDLARLEAQLATNDGRSEVN